MPTREEIYSALDKDPPTRFEQCWRCRWFEADELTFEEDGGDGVCVRFPPVYTGENVSYSEDSLYICQTGISRESELQNIAVNIPNGGM